MKSNVEPLKNNSNDNNKMVNTFFNNKNINVEDNENDNNKNIYKSKSINLRECKKILFDKINDDNSSSIQDNINENDNKVIGLDKINIIVDSTSSLLSDLTNLYGNNITKNEFIFNSLNTSVISNFSLSQKENKNENQIQNQNIKINKKSLKNNEVAISNVGSTTNISSNEKPPSRCTCKSTNCLKFYCECFANGKFCDNCLCSDCKNTQEHKELRKQKYHLIISRNPKAIQKINATKRSWTCKCKNSNCKKKYCDCFQNKRFCTSKCRCINCLNKNISTKPNNNNKKTKRVRGIKKEKMDTLIRRRMKRNKIIDNNENSNNEKEEKNKIEKEKPLMNYYTPKKQRNHVDKNDIYLYYKKESTTATLTGKKEERRKVFESNTTDKKRKDVYTKLQMDNV